MCGYACVSVCECFNVCLYLCELVPVWVCVSKCAFFVFI